MSTIWEAFLSNWFSVFGLTLQPKLLELAALVAKAVAFAKIKSCINVSSEVKSKIRWIFYSRR